MGKQKKWEESQIRLVDSGWRQELIDAMTADSSELRVVSPFIRRDAVKQLLALKPSTVHVITRFNLSDFDHGINEIAALHSLLDSGASVRGIRNLHAKLYLFGDSRAIVTSANLTKSALDINHELGFVVNEPSIIDTCRAYFDELWQGAENDLTKEQLEEWDKKITRHRSDHGRPEKRPKLGDEGTDISVSRQHRDKPPINATEAPQVFIKFFGGGDDTKPLTTDIFKTIKDSGCHRELPYSKKWRPTSVKDGAIMFIAWYTENPKDIRIIGRAIGSKYQEGRDDATPEDIERKPWTKRYPHYIRIHNAEFIEGTLDNGISLNELMDELESNSFVTTKDRTMKGEKNVDPRKSIRQQPAVRLSEEGYAWLDEQLQEAFAQHGKISESDLDELNWPPLNFPH